MRRNNHRSTINPSQHNKPAKPPYSQVSSYLDLVVGIFYYHQKLPPFKMVLAKSKGSVGLGNTLMNDRFGKGKGADRRKGTGVTRINHATGEEVCYPFCYTNPIPHVSQL